MQLDYRDIEADGFQFPLDSVKTRMQTYKYDNFSDCVRETYRTERWRGFFRGEFRVWNDFVYTVYWSTCRSYCAVSKCHSRTDNLFFGLPTLEIHLCRMVQTKLWFGSSCPRQHPWNISNILHDCLLWSGGSYGRIVYYTSCMYVIFGGEADISQIERTNINTGPFELTKLSAQVSVLMAESNKHSLSDPSSSKMVREVAASYQNKGTFKTAMNIVKYRGIMGLYSGFSLHLRKSSVSSI